MIENQSVVSTTSDSECLVGEARQLIEELDRKISGLSRKNTVRPILSRLTAALDDAFSLYEDNQENRPSGAARASKVRRRLFQALHEISGKTTLFDDGQSEVTFPANRFTVSEILQFLAFNEKTGLVTIKSKEETIDLELSRGRLIDARSDNSPPGYRIGEILVSLGALEREALVDFLSGAPSTTGRTGSALARMHLISRDQLNAALRTQIRYFVQRCLESDKAEVSFIAAQKSRKSLDFALDLTGLLLESTAVVDSPETTKFTDWEI